MILESTLLYCLMILESTLFFPLFFSTMAGRNVCFLQWQTSVKQMGLFQMVPSEGKLFSPVFFQKIPDSFHSLQFESSKKNISGNLTDRITNTWKQISQSHPPAYYHVFLPCWHCAITVCWVARLQNTQRN